MTRRNIHVASRHRLWHIALTPGHSDGASQSLKHLRMETNMTNSFNTETVINNVKTAFQPVTDAISKLQNMEVPEAARDFVKKQAATAQTRAAELHVNSDKVTSAIETAVAGSVSETAKIARNVSQAALADAQALFTTIEKLASAKSINEAVQINTDALKAQGEVIVGRAKATTEYLGKVIADGAKSAQDNFAKVTNFAKSA